MTPIAAWEEIDLADDAQRRALARDIARIAPSPGLISLAHEPAWLLEADGRSASDLRVFVLRRNDEPLGYVPLLRQPWALSFRLGEKALYARRYTRLHLNGEPLFTAALDATSRTEAIARLLTRLSDGIDAGELISLEGVVVGGALDAATECRLVRSAYVLLETSKRYDRALIRLPATFDAYMGSLKAQTRQNLRNSHRRLEKHLGGALSLVTCATTEDVAPFVERAVAISRRTYQWHLLGLGLREPGELSTTLTAMARHGWTRCYLLECAGAPTAFMIGYLYAGTYYYVDVGFDPAWEQWSVGTVLHLLVLRDLIEADPRAEWFDFSSGTGVHKKRFGNVSRAEKSVVLLPRTTRNVLLAHAHRATEALSSGAVHALEKLRLKSVVKRLMRRAAVAHRPS